MGEVKRRKAIAPIGQFAHRWTPETGAQLAELCGGDVRLDEVCILGWLIAAGQIVASDQAGMTFIIESARPRVRTAPEHWPKLIAAAAMASQDPVFVASGEPLYDDLRRGSAHSFAG
jgi:hypothetical protein